MYKKKNERNAGRGKKYEEETVQLNIRVPVSKKEAAKKLVNEFLKPFEKKSGPKKKSDAKASNSSNVGVAPEVGKIDSMLDAAFGQIKNPLDLPSEELDTSGKFEELKPKEPNITSNGKCYRVSVFTGGRFINQYRYLLTEAIALRHEMVSEIANNLKSK